MGLSINYYHVPELPKLAWLTCLDQKIFTELSVFYGSSVEFSKTWMVEGLWDGAFLLQKVFFRDLLPPDKNPSIKNSLAQSGHQFPHVDLGNPRLE